MREIHGEQLTSHDGLRLHLLSFGGTEGPPLVLVHGSFGHARVWDFVVDSLPEDHSVFALDLPGHGLSDHASSPERYRFPALVEDLHIVVDAMPGPPILAGHSLGSGLAMTYAVAHADRLAGAVFMDIDPQPPIQQVHHLHNTGSSPPKAYDDFARAIGRESRVAPNATPAVHEHLAKHGYVQKNGTWNQRYDQAFLRAVEQWDTREALRNVTIPSLVLRGEESTVMAAEAVELMVSRLPNAYHVPVAGAGHQLHLEQPDRVAAALQEFIERVRR